MASSGWEPVARLSVFYEDDGEAELVGGLAIDERGAVHFQYERSWIETRRELSPMRLPLRIDRDVVAAPDRRKLHGLHGLFADSLPDAWGMRVLEIALRRHGTDPQRAGALDRLSYLGARTMGALTYRPATDEPLGVARPSSLDRLAAQAEQVHEGTFAAEGDDTAATTSRKLTQSALDELERAAGSAGGAQPKVLVAVSPDGAGIVSGGEPPSGYTAYLLKFTPRRYGLGLRPDCGQLEHAFALMAHAAGVQMPRTKLFPTTDGRLHFGAARFDRTVAGGRRHVHTFGGLMGREASDAGDYDELFRVTRALTHDVRPLDEVVRRLCFNLAVLNDDDHLKNIAFLLDPSGEWRLAPAYDLTYSPSRGGERGMSVSGLEAGVSWRDVETLAATHGIRGVRTREIREQVEASVDRWSQFAAEAHVPAASVAELGDAFAVRRMQLHRRST